MYRAGGQVVHARRGIVAELVNFQFAVDEGLLSKFKLMARKHERSVAGQLRIMMAEFVRKESGRVFDPGADDETTPIRNEGGE
jgi:hypothetical protein